MTSLIGQAADQLPPLLQRTVGLRGLLIAGIFATTMGSLSTALNALATSFTRDWYQPYINPSAGEAQSLPPFAGRRSDLPSS